VFRAPEIEMKLTLLAMVVTTAVLQFGCGSVERSRALGDPKVSANTIAMQVCSSCHGVGGTSISPNFPNLAGQQEGYLVAQLKSFRSHNRSDPDGFEYMWGLSAHLTDEQIQGLAAYYASQQPRAGTPANDAQLIEGRSIFEKGVPANGVPACAGCHGAAAQGNQQFPRLAGQHAHYLVKQLEIFRQTEGRPEGSIMKGVAHSLTPENMENVAAYLEAIAQK
jgi:cytochrome c553